MIVHASSKTVNSLLVPFMLLGKQNIWKNKLTFHYEHTSVIKKIIIIKNKIKNKINKIKERKEYEESK